MVKVKNQAKLKWCLINYSKGKIASKWAAKQLGVSQKRVQQVYKKYCETGKISHIGLKIGRPQKTISQEWKNIVKQQYEQTCQNAIYLEKR